MRIEEIRRIFDQDQRITQEFPRTRREETEDVVRYIPSDEPSGFLLYSKLSPESADRVIDEQVAYFSDLGIEFEWKLYDYDTPSDLADRLIQRGFEADEQEAVMVLELESLPEILHRPIQVDIRRVIHPDEVDQAISILCKVWERQPEDYRWLHQRLSSDLRDHPQQLSLYLGYQNGKPAACAWTYFLEGSLFAGLWGGSTLVEARGKGLYTGLLAARALEALERGLQFLTVDAGSMSQPILEKLGFVRIAGAQAFTWKPGTGRT